MNKRMSYNVVAQIISALCATLISVFLTPFIVKNLGQESYGFVGLANNFTSYITMFTVALNGMLSRYVTIEYTKKNYEEASGFFSTAFITEIILALILIFPLGLLSAKLDVFLNISDEIVYDVKILWALMFFAFLAGLANESLGSAAFARNRVDIKATISIAMNILRALVLLVSFLFFTPHMWYVGLSTIAGNTVTIIGNFWCKRKLLPEVKISRKYYNVKYIKKLLVVGVWNSLNRLQQVLYTGLDLLLTNIFIDSVQMGLLSVAKTIPTQISSFISTISGTFDPSMTIAYGKGNKEKFLEQTMFAMKMSGFLCSVPIIGFVCFGKDFYTLWMGSLSADDIMKVHTLSVLTLLPQVFSVYIYPLYTVNNITCKLKVPVLVSLGIGVANIAIVYVLLQTTQLGVYAVAGVSSILWIVRIFTFVPIYAAMNVEVPFRTFYKPLLRGVLNVSILIFMFSVINHFMDCSKWLSLGFSCLVAAIVGYAVSVFVIFGVKKPMAKIRSITGKISDKVSPVVKCQEENK